MHITTNELRGKPVLALDGWLGRVEDYLFDDQNWVIRYLVTRTGTWFSNRLILLSPHILVQLDATADLVRVRLHKRQVETSPPLELPFPVSRRYEVEHCRYFGLPEYWAGSALWGRSGFPLVAPATPREEDFKLHYHREDKHLQSSNSLAGFRIQTASGPAGKVTGFCIDDSTWEVHDIVARAGHWYSRRNVLIAPASIDRIGYEDATVHVTLARADIPWTAKKGRTLV